MTPLRIQLSRRKGWRMPDNTVKVDRSTRWGNAWRVGDRMFAPDDTRADVTGFRKVENVADAVLAFRQRVDTDLNAPWTMRTEDSVLEISGGYSDKIHVHRPSIQRYLRGKNLACWCRLCDAHRDGKPLGVECTECAPCHADVLLEIANAPPGAVKEG